MSNRMIRMFCLTIQDDTWDGDVAFRFVDSALSANKLLSADGHFCILLKDRGIKKSSLKIDLGRDAVRRERERERSRHDAKQFVDEKQADNKNGKKAERIKLKSCEESGHR